MTVIFRSSHRRAHGYIICHMAPDQPTNLDARPTRSFSLTALRPTIRCTRGCALRSTPSYDDVFERSNRNEGLAFEFEGSERTTGGKVVVITQHGKLQA